MSQNGCFDLRNISSQSLTLTLLKEVRQLSKSYKHFHCICRSHFCEDRRNECNDRFQLNDTLFGLYVPIRQIDADAYSNKTIEQIPEIFQ